MKTIERREIHPWFDHPSIRELIALCHKHGHGHYSRMRGQTRAMTNARIEKTSLSGSPFIIGPTGYPEDTRETIIAARLIDDWLEDIGASIMQNGPYSQFEAAVGPERLAVRWSRAGNTLLAASENRSAELYLTTCQIILEYLPEYSATEEVIAGGREALLLGFIQATPIAEHIDSMAISKASVLSPNAIMLSSIQLKDAKS